MEDGIDSTIRRLPPCRARQPKISGSTNGYFHLLSDEDFLLNLATWFSARGVALIIVLAFVVLLTGLSVAYLSRSTARSTACTIRASTTLMLTFLPEARSILRSAILSRKLPLNR